MVDLHSHILYGVDDGCKTIDESIELIRKMLESGFNKIVLTPHYISNSDYNSNRENNLKIFNELRQKVLDNNLNVQLYLGNEIYLDNNSLTLLKNGTLSSIANTKYILFELPLGNQVRNVLDLIYEIKYSGFIPILAHPERYTYMQKDHDLLFELKKEGVLFQGNFGSALGYYGRGSKKLFKYLMKKHYYDFLATDIHSPDKTFVLDNFTKIQKKINKYGGSEYYCKLIENGANLLNEVELL